MQMNNIDSNNTEENNVSNDINVIIKELEEYKDLYLRAKAEVQNTITRHNKELIQSNKFATEKFLIALLPALDSIDCAIDVNCNDKGMVMTRNMFFDIFKQFGIVPIVVEENTHFNPDEHEAIKVEEKQNCENNTVLYSIQKGYKLHNRVVRPARVCVVQNKIANNNTSEQGN